MHKTSQSISDNVDYINAGPGTLTYTPAGGNLRDEFALSALELGGEFLHRLDRRATRSVDDLADLVYRIADAMMSRRVYVSRQTTKDTTTNLDNDNHSVAGC